ncbi:MAG TPA: hypothetical protein VMD08_12465 [Candidatus Baltobacteraceae bacterium]|nr:hypothetical protein [Candidatus Baltobacteraceae bacterium]
MKKMTLIWVLAALALVLAAPGFSAANGHVSVGIGIGVPGYWGPYPYAYPYYYPPAPVVVQQAPPPVVVQPPAEPAYWYYCQNPQGYYPYVQSCPHGWMKVVPQGAPPRP